MYNLTHFEFQSGAKKYIIYAYFFSRIKGDFSEGDHRRAAVHRRLVSGVCSRDVITLSLSLMHCGYLDRLLAILWLRYSARLALTLFLTCVRISQLAALYLYFAKQQ